MSKDKAKEMIVDLIGDEWLANVLEMDRGRKGKAYIAELGESVCLGRPIVVIESKNVIRYASAKEARAVAEDASIRGLRTPGLYL